jgi:hypothetical protein
MKAPSDHLRTIQRRADFLKSLSPKNSFDLAELGALEWALVNLQAERQPLTDEPYESPYNPNPVEYQYHYPDGSWRCSNGEVINGMRPDLARSLYALKDNT